MIDSLIVVVDGAYRPDQPPSGVSWSWPSKLRRLLKTHLTRDGKRTVCGVWIPPLASFGPLSSIDCKMCIKRGLHADDPHM